MAAICPGFPPHTANAAQSGAFNPMLRRCLQTKIVQSAASNHRNGSRYSAQEKSLTLGVIRTALLLQQQAGRFSDLTRV